MDLTGLSALLTSEGWALLESLPPYDESTSIALADRLRGEGHAPELVAAALTQSRLRARARTKFGPFADGMLFTPDGLEQATRLEVAARHAHRFVVAGLDRVVDLGCGLGSDAMAFASFDREVVAVERDELTAALATVNLRHWPTTTVQCADATELDLTGLGVGSPGTGVWVDPARRDTGRRTSGGTARRVTDPEAAAPPWSFVRQVADRAAGTGAKLSPGFPAKHLPAAEPAGRPVEAQWVSVGGDAVELAVWWGALAREGVARSALLLPDGPDDEPAELLDDGTAASAQTPTGPAAGWLYEPDAAVIQAGLVGRVAADVGGHLLQRGVAYLASERHVATPFARTYAIEDVMPFHVQTLRAYLRDRGVGRLTVKKRGVAVEPDQLRRQMRLEGDAEATVAVTRVGGQQTVLVLRPAAPRSA